MSSHHSQIVSNQTQSATTIVYNPPVDIHSAPLQSNGTFQLWTAFRDKISITNFSKGLESPTTPIYPQLPTIPPYGSVEYLLHTDRYIVFCDNFGNIFKISNSSLTKQPNPTELYHTLVYSLPNLNQRPIQLQVLQFNYILALYPDHIVLLNLNSPDPNLFSRFDFPIVELDETITHRFVPIGLNFSADRSTQNNTFLTRQQHRPQTPSQRSVVTPTGNIIPDSSQFPVVYVFGEQGIITLFFSKNDFETSLNNLTTLTMVGNLNNNIDSIRVSKPISIQFLWNNIPNDGFRTFFKNNQLMKPIGMLDLLCEQNHIFGQYEQSLSHYDQKSTLSPANLNIATQTSTPLSSIITPRQSISTNSKLQRMRDIKAQNSQNNPQINPQNHSNTSLNLSTLSLASTNPSLTGLKSPIKDRAFNFTSSVPNQMQLTTSRQLIIFDNGFFALFYFQINSKHGNNNTPTSFPTPIPIFEPITSPFITPTTTPFSITQSNVKLTTDSIFTIDVNPVGSQIKTSLAGSSHLQSGFTNSQIKITPNSNPSTTFPSLLPTQYISFLNSITQQHYIATITTPHQSQNNLPTVSTKKIFQHSFLPVFFKIPIFFQQALSLSKTSLVSQSSNQSLNHNSFVFIIKDQHSMKIDVVSLPYDCDDFEQKSAQNNSQIETIEKISLTTPQNNRQITWVSNNMYNLQSPERIIRKGQKGGQSEAQFDDIDDEFMTPTLNKDQKDRRRTNRQTMLFTPSDISTPGYGFQSHFGNDGEEEKHGQNLDRNVDQNDQNNENIEQKNEQNDHNEHEVTLFDLNSSSISLNFPPQTPDGKNVKYYTEGTPINQPKNFTFKRKEFPQNRNYTHNYNEQNLLNNNNSPNLSTFSTFSTGISTDNIVTPAKSTHRKLFTITASTPRQSDPQLSQLDDEMNKMKSDLAKQGELMIKKEEELNKNSNLILELKNEILKKKEEIIIIEKSLKMYSERNVAQESSLEALRIERDGLKESYNDALVQSDQFEAQISQLKNQIELFGIENNNHNDHNHTNNNNNNEMPKNEITTQNDEILIEKKNLLIQIDNLNLQIEKLSSELSTTTTHKDENSAQISSLLGTITELESQLSGYSSLSTEFEKIKSELFDKNCQNEENLNKNVELFEKISNFRSNFQNLEIENRNLNQKLDSLFELEESLNKIVVEHNSTMEELSQVKKLYNDMYNDYFNLKERFEKIQQNDDQNDQNETNEQNEQNETNKILAQKNEILIQEKEQLLSIHRTLQEDMDEIDKTLAELRVELITSQGENNKMKNKLQELISQNFDFDQNLTNVIAEKEQIEQNYHNLQIQFSQQKDQFDALSTHNVTEKDHNGVPNEQINQLVLDLAQKDQEISDLKTIINTNDSEITLLTTNLETNQNLLHSALDKIQNFENDSTSTAQTITDMTLLLTNIQDQLDINHQLMEINDKLQDQLEELSGERDALVLETYETSKVLLEIQTQLSELKSASSTSQLGCNVRDERLKVMEAKLVEVQGERDEIVRKFEAEKILFETNFEEKRNEIINLNEQLNEVLDEKKSLNLIFESVFSNANEHINESNGISDNIERLAGLYQESIVKLGELIQVKVKSDEELEVVLAELEKFKHRDSNGDNNNNNNNNNDENKYEEIITNLNAQINEQNVTISLQKEQIESSSTDGIQIIDLTAKLTQLNTAKDEERNEFEKKIDILVEKNNKIQNDYNSLQLDHTTLQTTSTILQNDIDNMLSQYSELNQKFKEFVQISEEISQISKTNEENCQNARNTIFEQSDQILTLERINDGLKNDVNSKDDRIRELEALLALKDAELGKKSEIGSEIGSEIENGQNGQKIKEKDDEILKLKNENENLLQQIEQININNEASLNQLNLLNFDKTQEELDKLQNTCAELQNMMAAKETENKIQIESIISQNEDKIKQFIDTSNDLNDKLDNITIVLEEEREKNHNLTQKVQNYENDFEHKNEQHQAYIDKLRLKKSQYKTQAFRISREATSLQEDMISKLELIDQLELQCNEFEIKIKSLEDHFVQNEDQIQILKHKNEQFDSQLKTKQNEYSSLQTQLDQLNERDRLVFAEFFALGLISSDDFETAMNKATQKE